MDGQEKQKMFTTYLAVAVERARKEYLNKKNMKEAFEWLDEPEETAHVSFDEQYERIFEEIQHNISYESNWFEVYMKDHMEDVVIKALEHLRATEFDIVCLHILKD